MIQLRRILLGCGEYGPDYYCMMMMMDSTCLFHLLPRRYLCISCVWIYSN